MKAPRRMEFILPSPKDYCTDLDKRMFATNLILLKRRSFPIANIVNNCPKVAKWFHNPRSSASGEVKHNFKWAVIRLIRSQAIGDGKVMG
jgi:hypothetical protein